jgi:aminoglycoside phosphotransferase (APT) family kinase protein
VRASEYNPATVESIADQLLGHLRAGTRSERTADQPSFLEPPVQVRGGFETQIFSFRLTGGPPDLAGPLILRLFAEPGGTSQARREAATQNAVAATGFPVPRVVFPGGDRTIAGRAFNVMERVPGRSMLDLLMQDHSSAPWIASVLAQTHANLHELSGGHELSGAQLEQGMREAGVRTDQSTLAGRLAFLERYAADPTMSHLRPALDWLAGNRPIERDPPALCHGDFHPGNVMVDRGVVTGVIDWTGAVFADAEHDVAITLVLITAAGPMLAGGPPPGSFEAFASEYLQAYERRRALDSSRLAYYRAYRLLRAFARGSARRIPEVSPALLPRDQYPWSGDDALRVLATLFAQITGIRLAVPSAAR